MKIKEIEHSVTSYDRTLRIEREGEVHNVIVHWDNTNGYECYWLNSEHRFQEIPKWALELEEENEDGDSLGWILEVMADTTAITERIRTYELEKVETYTIRATSEESAIEILNGLDNSSASRVEIRSVFASAPEASV